MHAPLPGVTAEPLSGQKRRRVEDGEDAPTLRHVFPR